MLCQKCKKEQSKDCFKKYTYWKNKTVYSKTCLNCQCRDNKNKKSSYKGIDLGSKQKKLHPELFCKRCGIKLKTTIEINKHYCSSCYKIIC